MSHQLVKKQHVLPKKSIARFCNEKGVVQAHRIHDEVTFPAAPKNEMFCVHRIWDQRAEQGYGKKVEDRFQSLVERVLASGLRTISEEENETVSRFYALWYFRSIIQKYDEAMPGAVLDFAGSKLTPEDKLTLELKHYFYIDEDGLVPMHFKRGIAMQMAIDSFIMRNSRLKWFVSESRSLEFVVSDNPEGEFIIPLTPSLCFICYFNVPFLSLEKMKGINLRAIMRSKTYYFAKNLSKVLYA